MRRWPARLKVREDRQGLLYQGPRLVEPQATAARNPATCDNTSARARDESQPTGKVANEGGHVGHYFDLPSQMASNETVLAPIGPDECYPRVTWMETDSYKPSVMGMLNEGGLQAQKVLICLALAQPDSDTSADLRSRKTYFDRLRGEDWHLSFLALMLLSKAQRSSRYSGIIQ